MKLELCAASIEAVKLAKKYQLDRIELCQNLEQGGITPSYGLIEFAVNQEVETHVLIRPRAGGFVYTPEEVEVMVGDIQACKRIGVKGVVIGALTTENEVDIHSVYKMIEGVGDLEVTFHRAFDEVSDFKKCIDTLVELKISRILTAGLAANVDEGMSNLQEIIAYSNNRIEIMSGGGVSAQNINVLKEKVQPHAIHFSATNKIVVDKESIYEAKILQVNEGKLKELI